MKLSQFAIQSGVSFGTSGARGLVTAMSDEVCYAYTQAFMRAVAASSSHIVLGHDLRPSSPAIANACAQAVLDAGKSVIFVGALPTPAVAYYAAIQQAPALVITGSHIPFDRNGIKFYGINGEITKDDEAAMLATKVSAPARFLASALPTVDNAARDAYLARYIDVFGADALTGKRVALYEHSSVARDLLRTLLQSLGATVISLGRTDTFVPIDTEAVRAEDVAKAQAWAQVHQFDVILSTDGDADRPLIGDESGNWLRGDIVGIFCAQYLRADWVVTPVSSNTATEKCGAFQRVTRTRIGSPYVIAGMKAASIEHSTDVVVGYEANGGFLLGSCLQMNNHLLTALPTRDAVLPMLTLLALATERNCSISELAATLPQRYTFSDRIQNISTNISRELIERLSHDVYETAALMAPNSGGVIEQSMTDGLRVTFATGDIVHLRLSGNAPELRCYTESGIKMQAQELCEACLRRLAPIVRRS